MVPAASTILSSHSADILSAPITAYSESRECSGLDMATGCTDFSEMTANALDTGDDSSVTYSNVKVASCHCNTDNCNTDVSAIDSSFVGYEKPAGLGGSGSSEGWFKHS